MITIESFEEADNLAEQLITLLQAIYTGGLSEPEKDILIGLALNLMQDLYRFCRAGAKKEGVYD
ncbi:hypothetical protein [Pantoea sp. NGS-ED-1003]|uniref:hypothetical protein n=1 Tax=Pantoea sp. NGS-ED-1003 TaxID=1526743 RepID=UPI0005351608|nr:hypothetical protein [Pantoea sp. NGS-ED-1003]